MCLPTTGNDYLFAVNLYINVIVEFKFEISCTRTNKEEPGSDLIGQVTGSGGVSKNCFIVQYK